MHASISEMANGEEEIVAVSLQSPRAEYQSPSSHAVPKHSEGFENNWLPVTEKACDKACMEPKLPKPL